MRKASPRPVSFRLSRPLHASLSLLAAESGKSVGGLARELVTAALQDEYRRNLDQRFEDLQRELRALRNNIATVLEGVLLNIARVPEDEVRRYVREQLRQ